MGGRYGVLPYQWILRIQSRRDRDARVQPENQLEFTLQRAGRRKGKQAEA
jgi:hypothetical protein